MSVGNSEVAAALADELISLPTLEGQAELLRGNGLLHPQGLDRLLDLADRLLNDDPGKARQLAEACGGLAAVADAPAAVPRADYIRAGAHGMNGQFDEELRLTRLSRDGYLSLGMRIEALRTDVGRMGVLVELGRYEEALGVGQAVLDTLASQDERGGGPESRQAESLIAFVHQNRGLCFEYLGRYERALDAFAVAEGHYRSLGMDERLGEISDNRGAILSHLGRTGEALAAHEAAAATFHEAGLFVKHAMALHNAGEVQLQLSEYMRSLSTFERVRRLYDSHEVLAYEYLLSRDVANAYLALNLHSEALTAYQEADKLLREAGMVHDRARALWGMGSVLIARSDLQTARRVLDEAATLFREAGNLPMLSGVMLEQASLLEANRDRSSALRTAQQALDIVSDGGAWPVQQIYARLRLADLSMPDLAAVESHLLAARRLADTLALPQLRYRLNERLGRLRRLQGRSEDARTLLEQAVGEIEQLRGAVAQDALRASFLRDKTAAYEDLLLLHLAREDEHDVRDAYAVAERAKSRALVDLLTGVAKEGAGASGLEERIGSLQADLNAIYSELLGDADDERPVPLEALHTRATRLETEISRLRLQAAAGSSSEPSASTDPPDQTREELPSDAALLAYHIVGDEIIAFVGARGRTRVARYLSTVDKVSKLSQKLGVQWDRFRAGREFVERHITLLERSARQVLAALYKELVAPLEPLLLEAASHASGRDSRVLKLAVVPHGPLHGIPFHALFDGERYVIERFEISYAPSATVYAMCQDRGPGDRDGAAVFGVDDPSIPGAATEARAVAEQLPGARVSVGEGVTFEALRDGAAASGTLHLACHGLFRSDNPMFSALKLHDGWLLAADAINLDLDGALVTLSACESGRSEVIGGDEVLGLTRAFLGAGAATLVVSLWLAQDETTAELMGDWYRRLRLGEGRVAALRAAQLGLMERYPHPYYWAPFVLLGKR